MPSSSVATTLTEEEVLESAGRHLAANDQDLPFALSYLYDDEGTPVLRAATGIAPDHPLARRSDWPIDAEVVELDAPDLPTGAWAEPPYAAVVLPFPAQGQIASTGFLIAALNRFRPLDDDYRGFLGLVAGQIALCVRDAGHAID